MHLFGANGVGHRPYGDIGERKEHDHIAKGGRCLGHDKEGGRAFANKVWRSWHAVALRQGGEGASKWCITKLSLQNLDGYLSLLYSE